MKLKILRMTLKWKWWDKIRRGEKKFEYREYRPYWISRLIDKAYDVIEFRNGYGSHRPKFYIDYLGFKIIRGIKTPIGDMKQFKIKLGELRKD